MPGWKFHIAAGVAVCITAAFLLWPLNRVEVVAMLGCIAGSLSPDLDIGGSKASRWSRRAAVLVFFAVLVYLYDYVSSDLLICLLYSGAATSVYIIVLLLVERLPHRGPTHTISASLIFMALFSPLLFATPLLLLIPLAGYQSHIVLDEVF